MNLDWMADAACLDLPPDLFFPEQGGTSRYTLTVVTRTCAACPVRVTCLQWALAVPETEGIFGGTTAFQRRRMTV